MITILRNSIVWLEPHTPGRTHQPHAPRHASIPLTFSFPQYQFLIILRNRSNSVAHSVSFQFIACIRFFSSLLSSKCAPKHTAHPFIFIFKVLHIPCLIGDKPFRPHHLTCGMRAINKSLSPSPVLPGNFGATLSHQESLRLHRESGSGSQESVMQNNRVTCTCSVCQKEVPGVIITRIYSNEGIPACTDCYFKIQQSRSKPYSKLMDKVAILETGYYLNRKQASIRKAFYSYQGAC